MKTRAALVVSTALVVAALGAGLFLSPQLADPMPSHWNAAGQVDGYTSRTVAVWLLPLVALGTALLLALLPSIDPLKANIARFRGTYNLVIVGLVAYLVYLHALTLAVGLGLRFNFTSAMMPALGLLFVGLGVLLRKAERNFFIGIRTPWTLSSDEVWARTHRLGAWTFGLAGVVAALSGLLGDAAFGVAMGAILVGAFVPVVYSYVLYARLGRTP